MSLSKIVLGLLAFGGLALAFAAPMRAEKAAAPEWNQFRGPNRDGISPEKGLLGKWESAPPLAWETSGLGQGFSSVAISGDIIVTMGGASGEQKLIGLSRSEKGRQLWATKVGREPGGGGYPGPRCTPTIDGDFVYAVGSAGDIVCCHLSDGSEVWRRNFERDFGGKMMSGWGFSESPLVDGDWVLCTPGSANAMIVALNKSTGETVWKSAVPKTGSDPKGNEGAGYSSIVISNGAGVKQYVTTVGFGCIGVRASDGRHLWTYNAIANGVANIPTPICDGDFVFASTGYGTGSGLIQLKKAGNGVRFEQKYFLDDKVFQNHHGGIVKIGDYLYAGHGHNNGFPICVQMKTGKIVWGGRQRGPGKESATLIAADGKLIFRYQDGVIALVEATPKKYNLLGKFEIATSGPSWSLPVASEGQLLLREQDKLFVYDIKAN
jgi:outer membrane protein assembly factor BamB